VVSRSSWSVVLLGRHGQSFFVVTRLDRRGQSSWSVIFSWSASVLLARRGQSSWSVVLCDQSFFVDGVYILWCLCTRVY